MLQEYFSMKKKENYRGNNSNIIHNSLKIKCVYMHGLSDQLKV